MFFLFLLFKPPSVLIIHIKFWTLKMQSFFHDAMPLYGRQKNNNWSIFSSKIPPKPNLKVTAANAVEKWEDACFELYIRAG